MTTKPHHGVIRHWSKMPCHSNEGSLGFYIVGLFQDHPDFAKRYGHTSYVVSMDGNEIETRNSRYTLVEPAPAE